MSPFDLVRGKSQTLLGVYNRIILKELLDNYENRLYS